VNDSIFRDLIVRTLAVVFILWTTMDCAAQPSPGETPPAQVPAVDDSDEDAPEEPSIGSRATFTPLRQQAVIQCLDLAREAVGRSDYTTALQLMERALSESDTFVPTSPSSEVAAHEEVRRLIERMPGDLRRRLVVQRTELSRQTWEQVYRQEETDLTGFVRQFGDLPLAIDAWWSLGCRERDRGRIQFAVSAFERMARHPAATSNQRAVALIAQFDALKESRRTFEAELVQNELVELNPQLTITIAGKSVTLQQWLADNLMEFRARAPADPTSLIADRLRRPVISPIWKQSLMVPLGAALNAREQTQREQEVRPIPILRPLIVGGLVIIRKLEGIYAYNLSDGENRWIVQNTEFREIDRKHYFENPAYEASAIDLIQRRTLADSIFGRMSTDGNRLYVIQEPDRAGEMEFDRDVNRARFRRGPDHNKLCAYSIESHELSWEIGGIATSSKDAVPSKETYGGYFFLGSPLVLDDTLFIVAQRGTELRLLAIESSHGSLIWSLDLGAVSSPMRADVQRSRVACPIVWYDGNLLCSTSAGAIVAVDPILRTLKWSYRYPATTITAGDLQAGPFVNSRVPIREPWWDAWREPFAAVQQPQVNGEGSPTFIFASPETDQLHAIRMPDGEPLWQVPRHGGLIVSGISDDLVIVIEGDFVRAHDVRTGQVRWRTMTGEVNGCGSIVGSLLILPSQSGGTILLNVRTGEILSDVSNTDSPLGTLAEGNSNWIAYSRQALMCLPDLNNFRQQIERELQANPTNESVRIRAAFLDLQAGDPVAAQGRLEGLETAPARELRRQALIGALRELDSGRSTAERSELSRQLQELAEDVDYKFAAAAAIGKSALAVTDLVAAVQAALDGLAAELDQREGLVKSSTVIVRKDRVLLGLIDEAYRRAKPDERQTLDNLFLDRLSEARKSPDRLALQRLAHQWRGLDWSRRVVAIDDERTLRKRTLAEVEFRLLDAGGSQDQSIAALALEKLAQRFERAMAKQDAREVRQKILSELPTARLPDGKTEAERVQNDPRIRDSMQTRPASAWPEFVGKLDIEVDRNYGGFTMVPMHAEPGSLAERLDVWVDRNGSEVLFRGESFFQTGQDEDHERKFTLSPSNSPMRGVDGIQLRQAWGIGRVVILLVGTELFAISPLDDQGEPNSRFLWSNSIDLNVASAGVYGVAAPKTGQARNKSASKQPNRSNSGVGPVRPGYLCYQKGTRLIAVETETGRELWQRLDLPGDVTVLGDDHSVYLWQSDKVLKVLSAIDGRAIEERVLNQSPASLIHSRGSLVWTVSRQPEVQIQLTDLQSGGSIWTRTEQPGTKVSVLDPETLVVATTEGLLHLLAARTGEALCDPVTFDAESMRGVITWYDNERWYISVTRQYADPALKSAQSKETQQLVFLKGVLYAVDRFQPKLVWQRELNGEPLPTEHSRAAPVFVQLWKVPPKGQNQTLEATLRLVDKRSGKLLREVPHLDQSTYFLLNPDPQQAIVELRLARQTIRLTYTDEEPPPSEEADRNKPRNPK